MISSQFKHPQVHVGNRVEGAAGQQNHFDDVRVLHAAYGSWLKTTTDILTLNKQTL